jgi:succinylglutamate desuccinylase/aspartoacylase family protein
MAIGKLMRALSQLRELHELGEWNRCWFVQRLGKNIDRYSGETIEISEVLNGCVAAARANGWSIEKIPAAPKPDLLALTRWPALDARQSPHVYISAGIHGDEPAGPLAIRQLLQENKWPADAALWLCPCLNPTGFALNRRENDEGLDLNRQYLQPTARETITHMAWLEQLPAFDLCLCLHEDWESHGFYVYELNPDNRPSLAEPIINRVAEVCPIDRSENIEGRPAQGGIIRPSVDPRSRPQWPEAFFLLTRKTRLSYTLEAPSDFPLSTRVAALVAGVRAAVEAVEKARNSSTEAQ